MYIDIAMNQYEFLSFGYLYMSMRFAQKLKIPYQKR